MRGAVETVAVARDVASSSPSKPTAALDMMRYQRPNPDCLPLPNGIGSGSRKPAPPSAPAPAHRSSKDEAAPAVATDSSRLAAYLASTSLEPKQRSRAPPPPPPPAPSSSLAAAATRSPARDHGHHASDFSDPASPSYLGGGGGGASGSAGPAGGGGGGEVLLQWGHNKRTRGRRDASAGAASPLRRQPGAKIPRRSSAPDKLMPPPSGPSYTRGSNLRVGSTPPARGGDAHHGRGCLPHHRSAEERVGVKVARTEKQQRPDKQRVDAASPVMGLMIPDQKQLQQAAAEHHHYHHQAAASASKPPKLEMPRIYTTLSRKEKEEDFLAMKGTKLPVRPKKRLKTVEKAVNFICPGMWLTDVTRNRYEVREKKCPKKQKHRGLKGMESMDSDSD